MPAKRRQKALDPIRVGSIVLPRYLRDNGRVVLIITRGGRRTQHTYPDLASSKLEGERIARELHNAGAEGQTPMPAAERAEWALCKRIVAESGSRRPISEILRAGLAALVQPVHPSGRVLEELLASKQASDLQGRYLRGLRNTCRAFCTAHPGPIDRIQIHDIERWLAEQRVGPRRRDNMLSELRHLFTFARSRGYLPVGETVAARVPAIHRLSGSIGIFTIAEMQLMLTHVDDAWLPYLAIAAFSGIRTEEIALAKDAAKRKDPLRGEDFDWQESEICVRAETAKTGSPRHCPIPANLAAWLAPWRDRGASAPVAPPHHRPDREMGATGRLLRAINADLATQIAPPIPRLEWKHNGLRHSYGSYRMAVLKNASQLSYEMGNSVAMIRRHYHNPRPTSQGEAWFAIAPESPDNVLQMPLRLGA